MSWEDFKDCDDDDVPIILLEQRDAHQRGYKKGYRLEDWKQPFQSRTWNDETPFTEEMEQPRMSNLERLLKKGIERLDRFNKELDEEFDWNFEPYHEEPYDISSNAIEHLEDVEAIEHNDYYSNDDAPYSSNFVFQDDSDDEMDEDEEENEDTNYPHEVSQSVLQEPHSLELKLTESSEFEDSDFEVNIEEEVEEILVLPSSEIVSLSVESIAENVELEHEPNEKEDDGKVMKYTNMKDVLQELHRIELEVTGGWSDSDDEEESMEEEVEEILVIPDLEAVDFPAVSSIVDEHKPIISSPDSYDATSFTKDAIVDYDADIKELQKLIGISDHELNELVKNGVGDDLILEAEIENLYRASSKEVQTGIGGGDLDDPSIKESKSGLMSHSLPCNCECMLMIEPKPPDYLLVESVFSSGIVESNILHGQMNKLLEVDRLAMLERSIEFVHLNYFEEPPDCFCILVKGFSEYVGITSHSHLNVAFIKFIIRPLKKWKVYVHVMSFNWRMCYRNDKTKEDILLCEYDEKGGGYVMKDWL